MSSVTVTSAGKWGDNSILSVGTWEGLESADVVDLNGYVVTIDKEQQNPIGINKAISILLTDSESELIINNQSTTSATRLYGGVGLDMDIQNFAKLTVSGNFITLQESASDWTSDGTGSQSISGTSDGWRGAGYDILDYCSGFEVEESGGEWVKWSALHPSIDSQFTDIGVGDMGRFFEYDPSDGSIIFGDDGKPTLLTATAATGQKVVEVSDTSDFVTTNVVHLIDDNGQIHRNVIDTVDSGVQVTLLYDIQGSNFTTTNNAAMRLTVGGKIPENGARIRVPNILIGSMNSSYVIQNPTAVSSVVCFEIDTSSDGIVSIDKCYFGGIYANFTNALSVSLTNLCSHKEFLLQNLRESPTIENINASNDPFNTVDDSCFILNSVATVSITDSRLVVQDVSLGVVDAYNGCADIAISGSHLQIIDMTYSSFNSQLVANRAIITFTDCDMIGARTSQDSTNDIFITDCRCSMSPTGLIGNNYPMVTGIKNIINGFTSIPEGCLNNANPVFALVGGIVNGNFNVLQSGWGGNNVFMSGIRSANLVYKNISIDYAPSTMEIIATDDAFAPMLLQNITVKYGNLYRIIRPFDLPNNITYKQVSGPLGDLNTGTKTGCHFADGIYDYVNKYGFLALLWGSKTSNEQNAYTTTGDVILTGSRLYIASAGGSITYTYPYKVMGHSFRNLSPQIGGSGTGNFTVEYSINGGVFDDATAANLFAENYTDMEEGFDFSIKISRVTASKTEYVNEYYIYTSVDFENHPYPEKLVDVTLQNIQDGSEYWLKNETTGVVLGSGNQSGTGDITVSNVPYNGVDETIIIRVRQSSTCVKYKPFETTSILDENGSTIFISQIIDGLTCTT